MRRQKRSSGKDLLARAETFGVKPEQPRAFTSRCLLDEETPKVFADRPEDFA